MAKVTIKRSGVVVVVDSARIADVVSTAAIGAIVGRQEDGLDVRDDKMKPYSPGYLAELKRKGEATNVDHRRTGTMLNNVRELSRTVDGDVVRIRIGVAPVAQRNLIAAWLQAIRRWFGLSPNDKKLVRAAITKARGLLKKRPSSTTRTLR